MVLAYCDVGAVRKYTSDVVNDSSSNSVDSASDFFNDFDVSLASIHNSLAAIEP